MNIIYSRLYAGTKKRGNKLSKSYCVRDKWSRPRFGTTLCHVWTFHIRHVLISFASRLQKKKVHEEILQIQQTKSWNRAQLLIQELKPSYIQAQPFDNSLLPVALTAIPWFRWRSVIIASCVCVGVHACVCKRVCVRACVKCASVIFSPTDQQEIWNCQILQEYFASQIR